MKREKPSKEMISHALHLSQNLMKHRGDEMKGTDRRALHQFISKALSGNTLRKISIHDCDKILNIAKNYL